MTSIELVNNWILKAENDFKTGSDEFASKEPATDTICFHMQQCVEKYLKAYLIFKNMKFRKTHDIAELIEICKESDNEFDVLYVMNADMLTVYGTEVRYPDDFYMPTSEETKKAVEIAYKVKDFIKRKINN